jgi:hypothetical protein
VWSPLARLPSDLSLKCSPTGCVLAFGIANNWSQPLSLSEIPTVSKHEPSTPTSVSVKWPYIRPHDSAYDAGSISRYHVIYNISEGATNSSIVSSPSKGMQYVGLTRLRPSTRYTISVQIEYSFKGQTVVGPRGPTATLQTESCTGNHYFEKRTA